MRPSPPHSVEISRLAPSGRFECVQEETGAVLYTLQGARGEPFTVDSLRIANVQGGRVQGFAGTRADRNARLYVR